MIGSSDEEAKSSPDEYSVLYTGKTEFILGLNFLIKIFNITNSLIYQTIIQG